RSRHLRRSRSRDLRRGPSRLLDPRAPRHSPRSPRRPTLRVTPMWHSQSWLCSYLLAVAAQVFEGRSFHFSTHFHTRINPLTSPPTPSNPATSAPLIRTNPPRSNDDAVHPKQLLTISNSHVTIPCESKPLSLSDDPVVSAPPLRPPRLCVILFGFRTL